MQIMKKNTTPLLNLTLVLVLIAIFFLESGLYAQTSHSVAVTSNIFTPKNITVNVGDTVVWTNSNGRHNVNGTQSTYPNNAEFFGNSPASNWTFSHVFTKAGMNDYQCDPHVGFGMIGSVNVLAIEVPTTLTVRFAGMTPHVGEMLTLYLKDLESGLYVDTVVLAEILASDFELQSDVIEDGRSYHVDIFADHNGNGVYDAPPIDHAWRLELLDVDGDTLLTFTHNTNFTDLFDTSGVKEFRLSSFKAYPNPVSNNLYLAFSGELSELVKINMIDMTGQVLLKLLLDENKSSQVIDMSQFPSGIYFLTLISKQEKKVQKLIKN